MTLDSIKIDPQMVKLEAQTIYDHVTDEITKKGHIAYIVEFLEKFTPLLEEIEQSTADAYAENVPSDIAGYLTSLQEKFETFRSGKPGPLATAAKTSVAIAEIRALQLALGI